jgi:hypothetical protein
MWKEASRVTALKGDLIKKPKTFEEALKALPACVFGGLDHPKTISDLRAQAEHELDMFNEAQDGCITCAEAQQVKKFLEALL